MMIKFATSLGRRIQRVNQIQTFHNRGTFFYRNAKIWKSLSISMDRELDTIIFLIELEQ